MTTEPRPRRKVTIDLADDAELWAKLEATAREHQWALAKLTKIIVADWGHRTSSAAKEAA
jgi:hypothetical protein